MDLRLHHRARKGIAFLCSLALVLSPLPVFAEETSESLENKTSDLEGQLADINQDLLAISNQIATTEMQVEITNGEILRTKDSLAETQAKEAQQYDNMKSRIKYMYENGNASLLEMLFSAEDISDFLNKADFIQNISNYDRQMLTELQETRDQIAAEEKTLKEQQSSLLTLKDELDNRQAALKDKAASTSTDLEQFKAQLEQLRAKEAAELAAQAAEKEENAPSNPGTSPGNDNSQGSSGSGTGGDIIQDGSGSATASELELFAALLDCEAISDYNSMLAVATVIMNRVDSSLFPNSITDVIYAPGQFEPVWSGRLDAVLASGASGLARQVAQDAVNGSRLAAVSDCYYFLYAGGTNRPGVNIGGNLFFPSW